MRTNAFRPVSPATRDARRLALAWAGLAFAAIVIVGNVIRWAV